MLTSLFRRHSNGGNHGDVTAHRAELNRGCAGDGGCTVQRLEFDQAMEDFRTMFPSMEQEVIECVLRANHGAVDSTIDQLLQLNLDGHDSDDSSDSDDSIPPEILEQTLEPDSCDEEAPPICAPPPYHMHMYDRRYPGQILSTTSPPPSFDASQMPPCQPLTGPPPHASQQQAGMYRNWNPPLLGNLPDDFLRLVPLQLNRLPHPHSSLTQPSSSLRTTAQPVEPEAGAMAGARASPVGMETDQEWKLKQYLEDERIALILQNDEFLRELQRNHDFLIALERDRICYESKRSKSHHLPAFMGIPTPGDHCASDSGMTCANVSEEALFRDKLKLMGKSTRKKLFEIARAFSEKTRRRKAKRRALLKSRSMGKAASTANLLGDEEARHLTEEDSKFKRPVAQEEDVPQQEVMS
ncbi:hypothetical protein DPEC_G00231230 [Dallia pectoralis]|uniref:Uncharacterized protein n=1 Tax=Dallia pectoralis TaxID=75939 RepID=A0ACC2FWR4_DALPE|nr:hypothetical protein DPEC_G00231230 [Dallia pectoralis]